MTIGELLNILRSYDPDLEFMISSPDDIWSVDQESFRETTIHETSEDLVVDDNDYDEKQDGTILSTRKAVVIELDI